MESTEWKRGTESPSTEDDERLARMLQYQEQTEVSHPESFSYHGDITDEQERKDSELARRFAQMEMNEGSSPAHSTSAARRLQRTHSHSPSRPRMFRGGHRTQSLEREDSRRFSYPARSISPSERTEPTPSEAHERRFEGRRNSLQHSGSHTGDSIQVAGLEDMEYARRQQEAAFARLRQQASPGAVAVTPSAEEQADMAFARRLQEMENSGMGRLNSQQRLEALPVSVTSAMDPYSSVDPISTSSTNKDERIARLMAATGKSLRDLQANEEGEGEAESSFALSQSSIPADPLDQGRTGTIGFGRASNPSSSNTASPLHSLPNTPLQFKKPSVAMNPKSATSAPTSPHVGGPVSIDVPVPLEKKKKPRNFLGFRSRQDKKQAPASAPLAMTPLSMDSLTGIPAGIPPPPGGSIMSPTATVRPLSNPASVVQRVMSPARVAATSSTVSSSVCFTCGKSHGSFVAALDKKYHPECFRCVICHELIDISKPFAFSKDAQGFKHPHHPRCYSQKYASSCCVCRQKLPANENGTISFVKHPFFDTEEMCPRHAVESNRRCTGCHRFEPDDEHFIDLNDGDRCICFSCFRSVVVDTEDAEPLWHKVIAFFKEKLGLTVWEGMEDIPIMIVGHEALNDQLQRGSNVHGGAAQIMTRGLCLTEHENCSRRIKLNLIRFNENDRSYESQGGDGYTYYDVPKSSKANSSSNVFGIMCLSGLPRDLTASVLAHEATHAWIKMHPQYDVTKPIPPLVEEGCAQLLALLFLNDGLDPCVKSAPDDKGPSDAKLRQYFRFSIETEENEIYGAGYRQAAAAYQHLGIEALLMHVMRYRDFPHT
jgi:hypothetical protein